MQALFLGACFFYLMRLGIVKFRKLRFLFASALGFFYLCSEKI